MAEVLRLRDYNKMKGLSYDPMVDGFVCSSAEIEAEASLRERRYEARLAEKLDFNYAEFQKKAA